MSNTQIRRILTYFIAGVWFVNGLLCKILDLVPRHGQIVARILGPENARVLTVAIGVSEVLMAIWVLSGIKPRLNAIVQMLIIATMNTLEFILVPDLLLWGRLNSLYAFIFILVIYFTAFKLHPTSCSQD